MPGASGHREDDLATLWEHLILNDLAAFLQDRPIHSWRDKNRHELDFVLAWNPEAPVAIEAEWKADTFDPGSLGIFRKLYPEGPDYLVAHDVDRPYTRRFGDLTVRCLGLGHVRELGGEV